MLSFIGPDSVRAAEVAAATSLQDKYWSFAEAFFDNQGPENTGYVDDEFLRGLLDLFLIQKAAYEISYELENRPAWVSIPLRGLLEILRRDEAAP